MTAETIVLQPSVIDQWEEARKNLTALLLAAGTGIAPPLGAFVIGHYDLRLGEVNVFESPSLLLHPLSAVMAACMAYSMRTIFVWGRDSSGDHWSAACLVLALEGLMVCSPHVWLGLLCLIVAAGINTVAKACHLARQQRTPRTQPAPAAEVAAARAASRLPETTAGRLVVQRPSAPRRQVTSP